MDAGNNADMTGLREKKRRLDEILAGLGSAAVAYSSGVDSTFLLKAAHDVLGSNVIAVTARSPLFPADESREAVRFCESIGIKHIIFDADVLSLDAFRTNPPDRCYRCKLRLFSEIKRIAAENGMEYICEGSNLDDLGDYRPGMRAVAELGIKSPLREAGLTKSDIRLLSREMGLPTWDKPSFACLASRFAYGDAITAEKLSAVERAERKLRDVGIRQLRVRHHGDVARIEVCREDFARLIEPETADEIVSYFRRLGYLYVSLDLEGYSTGSMNRAITSSEDKADGTR